MASLEDLVAVGLRHAQAEADGDMDGTMATLCAEPVYELQPVGRKFVGRDNARRYYEWFFANFAPRITNYELRAEWINEHGVAQEYVLWVRDDDGNDVRHEILGILTFDDELLSGERLFATEALFREMIGPLYDDTVPV